MQITGMLLGMTGTIIVSIGDAIVKLASRCYHEISGRNKVEESFEDDPSTGEYRELKD
jgi:hypothetical protein